MVGPQRPLFVLFGSSIAQLSFSNGGWGAILSDIYARKADILLRGYYGWNSRRAIQVLDKVFPKSLSDTTRIIFLSCPPVNEAKVRENTSSIFSQLVRTNELCRRYSEACIELCQEMDVKVVDLWTALQKRDDWLTACFTDGVHLSADGSKIVVEEILKVLKEAEWNPSLNWKSMPTEFGEDSLYDLVASNGKTTINPSEWTFHREIQWD
ncbi:GDSL esterase/lipase WDL1 isoform X2 [Malania oleifera]|uniref:GDSL esterase/lipase WDL1 isoform X2 n=1 Tax=Malania oleifera TaxID=397392 RepID=UPI0025ADC985|nr:GDSL esterase/lipase WDL1 isoform X2 [Malania oleifera]